jgi:tetratricopeptide (TPR) repeat protein
MKKSKQGKNKTKQVMLDISEEMINISSLINQGKFKKALERIESCEKQNPGEKTIQINKLGFLVDIGFGLHDQKIVQQGLDIGEHFLISSKNIKYKADIHYNLANGYLSLFELSEKENGIDAIPQSVNLQKAKSHFRDAKKLCNNCDPNIKKQIWVNYGNCLDTLGRGVEALYAYDEALTMDKYFSMAIGNKAKALRFFADISGAYRGAIYLEAYQAIKSIIDNQDLISIGGLRAKKSFEDELLRIEAVFKDKKNLTKIITHQNYNSTGLSEFEKFYLEYCVREKLFLNFHVHENKCEASITDPIFISLITTIEDKDTFYLLAKYINQIKEDYAVARLLLVQSQFKRRDFDSISKRTTFVNTLDYSQFNLYYGLLKSAFKEAYNILDKIAVFINDYYKLEMPEDRIYFTSIWYCSNCRKIRDEILKSKNISLYALYDIYQDFKSGYHKKIQNIRNASTHRKLVIFDSMPTTWDKKDDKHNIGYGTMLSETISLLRLAKSAIIYLINFVNIEENKKGKGGLIAPMFVDTSQFL